MSVRCYSSSRNDSESSYAAVYLRCALPRLRTAMRLLVWVDDETKGAASVRDRLHTPKRAAADVA